MAYIYRSKREKLFGIVFLSVPISLFVVLIFTSDILIFLIISVISCLFLWIWFGTGYKLDEYYLFYHSGPIRGKIPVTNIISIKCNVQSWVGSRPALAFNYLQIRYNTYSDIFIAPKEEKQFIEDLKNINPEITIEN